MLDDPFVEDGPRFGNKDSQLKETEQENTKSQVSYMFLPLGKAIQKRLSLQKFLQVRSFTDPYSM